MPRKHRPKRVIVLGIGGNSMSIADAMDEINLAAGGQPRYELAGFLDDAPELRETLFCGRPVLGSIRDATRFNDCYFINGIASAGGFRNRAAIAIRSGVPPERFETIVHPRAVIARNARVGRGCAIMANAVICPAAIVADHVLILQNTTVNHDAVIEAHTAVSAGVTILGHVRIGQGAYIGGGVSIAPHVKIGAGALLGMGAVVIRDVAPGLVVAGNPAHEIKSTRQAGTQK